MDKLPFEDGTLVKAGYVEIDGVKYETVQPEYTGKTPLSAYNLKKMQDNVGDAINDGDLVRKIKISGASKQETREGYNKLNVIVGTKTENGITFTAKSDGSILVNGTARADATYTIQEVTNYLAGDYILSDSVNGTATTYFTRLYKGTSGYDTIAQVTNSPAKYTLTENTDIRACIIVRSGAVVNNIIFKPMIVEGTQEKPYEQYGVSPSIDYSNEVKSVGDNINIYGKEGTITELGAISETGGFSSSTTRVRNYYNEVKGNTNYIINSSNKDLNIVPYFYDSSKVFISYNDGWKSLPCTFKTPTNARYVAFLFKNSTDTISINDMTEVKLEENSKSTPYSPYGQGSIEIKQDNGLETTDSNYKSQTKVLYTQKPFRAIGDVRDRFVKQNGVWHEEHNISRKKFDGTEDFAPGTDRGYKRFQFTISDIYQYTDSNRYTDKIVCSHFKPSTIAQYEIIFQYKNTILMYANFSTVDEFKAKLAELYNAGTPVYVDYVTTTPELIPCTAEQVEVLNEIYSAYGEGLTNIICTDEIEPVIEIIKESKETVQSENDKAISALLERVSQLEAVISSMQTTTAEGGV